MSVLKLPSDFVTQMKDQLGNEFDAFQDALANPAPVSIRLNPLKPSPTISNGTVPWCESGRYLDQRPSFTLDPHLHAGAYYVQEASSMFLEQAVKSSVDLREPLRALDLCAAPGGKSTHLLSLLSRDSLLVCNETIRSRAFILSENIQKWGHANVMVTNNDPSAFSGIEGFFDLVVIDAPCSGEGLFRKDAEAVKEWSADAVQLCSARQRRIIQDVWPALKTNGVLIYCTCTYNELENEGNLKWLSEQHDVEFLPIKGVAMGVQEVRAGRVMAYRFLPHLVNGEGFFICAMRKLETEERPNRQMSKAGRSHKPSANWLKGDFITQDINGLQVATPAACASDIDFLSSRLNVILRGVAVGTTKHGKFVPEHSLALSTDISKEEFKTTDITREQALQYLRKESMMIPDLPKGLTLIQFEGNPIGWANVLDNRINNLYPSNWRIKNL